MSSGQAFRISCSRDLIRPVNDFCSVEPGFQKKKLAKTRTLRPVYFVSSSAFDIS
jgi:hypothetical protein